MSKRVIVVLLLLLLVLTNGAQFFLQRSSKLKLEEEHAAEVASLQATIQAYGTNVTCYTVPVTVMSGDLITEDSIVEFDMPSSYITDQCITNPDEIIGKYFKIPITYGTCITYDMVMSEDIYDDTKDYDIWVDSWTVGLKVGDYIDLNIIYPYGDVYTVFSKKRIYAVNGNTLKVYLNKGEYMNYQGAFVDYALNKDYGTSLNAVRYVEPGLQQAAVSYYAPPDNIAALIQADPNVVDKQAYADIAAWRGSIDDLLILFRDEEDTVDVDGAKLAGMRETYNGAVKTDATTEAEAVVEEEETTEDDMWSSALDTIN